MVTPGPMQHGGPFAHRIPGPLPLSLHAVRACLLLRYIPHTRTFTGSPRGALQISQNNIESN